MDDNGTPNLSATQSFSVTVIQPVKPVVNSYSASNGHFGLSVSGDVGPDYTLLASTNLMQWTPLWTNNPAVLPTWLADPQAMTNDHQFYRVVLGP
jgi:hypothetical protein